MLTEQSILTSSSCTDVIPIGFVTTDDGRTFLAVTEHEDDALEIMATPVTFMVQNTTGLPTFVKAVDGNLLLQPSLLQINVEDVDSPSLEQNVPIAVQTLEGPSVVLQDNVGRETDAEASDALRSAYAPLAVSKSDWLPSDKERRKATEGDANGKSPGRPRKIATALSKDAESIKCEICQQQFSKQTLYRKHIEYHAEEKPHRCPKCPASFNIPSNFTLHMATHNTGDLKCPECGRKYARMASLKSHMLLHEKEENLFCTECEDAFSTKAHLDAHLKLHGEKWLTDDVRKCKLCNKQFVQPALYRLHIREHYRLQTKIAKQTKRGTKQKTMYKCTICLKSFQKPSQLMRHIRVHTGEKPFKCTVCNRAFTQKSSLQIHTWQHNGIRPHGCELCNAKFSQKGNLNAHILRVHNAPEGEPIYGCTYCSCIFKKLGSLNGHIKRMHSNASEEKGTWEETPTEGEVKATVETVMSQLASLESGSDVAARPAPSGTNQNDILQQALNNSGLPSKKKVSKEDAGAAVIKRMDARTSFVTLLDRAPDGGMRKYLTIKQRCIGNIRWYACSFCHKEFKKPSDLIRHLRVHTQEKPFKCSHCFRSFALKSTMIAHERTHTGTKEYSCASCDKTFACHSSLTAHVRLHTKPHKCSVCDKSFSAGAILKSHMKSHSRLKSRISPEAEMLVPEVILQEPLVISESGNKISVAQARSNQRQLTEDSDVARPHKCWVCCAAFRKVSHLKQHYRRHTGERPYKCTKCERRFTSNSVLKSHLQTHEETRPYVCTVCGMRFSTQSSTKRHLVTHSNKRPFVCPYCHKTFKTYVNCRKHMKIHKEELAQRQLELRRREQRLGHVEEKGNRAVVVPTSEGLGPSEGIEMSFQDSQIPAEFAQGFPSQFQSELITVEKDKHFLPTASNGNLSNVNASGLTASQTLHADETGTVTIPNYTGEQALTAESIREIEETLNQQLFNIGVNLGLEGGLQRQMSETRATGLGGGLAKDHQSILNIVYENEKTATEEVSSSSIFGSQFEAFDMGPITLQTANELEVALGTIPRAGISPATDPAGESKGAGNRRDGPRSAQQLPIDGTEARKEESSSRDSLPMPFAGAFRASPASKIITSVALPSGEESPPNLAEAANTTTRRGSLLQCHVCGKEGFTTAGLKEHLKNHRGSKEYRCTECSLRFCTSGGLSRHSKLHRSKSQWKCTVCEELFESRIELRTHGKIHVNEWRAFPPVERAASSSAMPPVSSVSAKVLLDAMAPMMVPGKEAIEKEKEKGEQTKEAQVEMGAEAEAKAGGERIGRREGSMGVERKVADFVGGQERGERAEYTNKCEYCPKSFRKPSDLIRHVRTHTGERPYKCNHCTKSFAVKCTLDSHVKVHTGKKTFCCHVCSSLFATKGSLKVHMRLHTGSKPFSCPVCDSRFRTSGHRKVHLLKHTEDYKGSSRRKQKRLKVAAIAEVAASLERSEESAGKPVLTSEGRADRTGEYASYDAVSVETALGDQVALNTAPALLNNNSILSISVDDANLHFLLANGLVTIQTEAGLLPQSSSTSTTELLEGPELIAADSVATASFAGGESKIVGVEGVGGAAESRAEGLGSITVDPAPGQRKPRLPFRASQSRKECDICGKTFMKPYQVERHKRIHTGERPYKCDLCTKSFAQKSTLQMHQKHHTGDRPYPCPHCEYSFTQKGNLHTHMKRVHRLDAADIKKLRRPQQTTLGAKLPQDHFPDAKILGIEDISFVEFLR